ncbi:hypothetical protein ACOME3_007805 [Neoechinorhynchus agilis]
MWILTLISVGLTHINFLDAIKFSVDKNRLVDEDGRLRVFHGINVVQKSPPYLPDKIDAAHLRELGLNTVRLGFTWAAVEPYPFQYNRTYLSHLRFIIDSLAPDIYVLVDMHQDMLSSRFGSYDSIPNWMLQLFPPSKNPYPWPFIYKPNNVFLNYLTSECSEAFENLFHNTSQALEHLALMWLEVVKVVDNATNILQQLGFVRLFANPYVTVLSIHYYCLEVYQVTALIEIPKSMFNKMCKLRKWNILSEAQTAFILTEFGACAPSVGSNCRSDVLETMELGDRNSFSWMFWIPSSCQDSCDNLLSRCYPSQVAGKIIHFSFNVNTLKCEIKFVAQAKGLTVIITPDFIYHGQIAVFCTGMGSHCKVGRGKVTIIAQHGGEVVSVVIEKSSNF